MWDSDICSQTKSWEQSTAGQVFFSCDCECYKTGLCENHINYDDGEQIKKKEEPCVRPVPEKWWWKQILASRWWKGMSTPSSLTELPFRSPDSSSLAKASLTKTEKQNKTVIPVTRQRKKRQQEVEGPKPEIH